MDIKKLELLLSVTVMALKLLILAQKSGLLFRGSATGELRRQTKATVAEAELLLQEVEEYMNED